MASHLLGISGRKRSGKDTFAERLVSDHGFTRIAFADPLKAVAYDLNPIVAVEDYGTFSAYRATDLRLSDVLGPDTDWDAAKEVPEVRSLLQNLGVAVRTHVGEHVWVQAALTAAAAVPGPVVITDVRFPNEVAAVLGEGGRVARIVRPLLVSNDTHVSETALDTLVPHYYIANDRTVSDLHEYADTVARHMLSGA